MTPTLQRGGSARRCLNPHLQSSTLNLSDSDLNCILFVETQPAAMTGSVFRLQCQSKSVLVRDAVSLTHYLVLCCGYSNITLDTSEIHSLRLTLSYLSRPQFNYLAKRYRQQRPSAAGVWGRAMFLMFTGVGQLICLRVASAGLLLLVAVVAWSQKH